MVLQEIADPNRAPGVLAPWGILLSPARGALSMSLGTVIVAINAQLLRRERLSYPDQVRVAADLQKTIS